MAQKSNKKIYGSFGTIFVPEEQRLKSSLSGLVAELVDAETKERIQIPNPVLNRQAQNMGRLFSTGSDAPLSINHFSRLESSTAHHPPVASSSGTAGIPSILSGFTEKGGEELAMVRGKKKALKKGGGKNISSNSNNLNSNSNNTVPLTLTEALLMDSKREGGQFHVKHTLEPYNSAIISAPSESVYNKNTPLMWPQETASPTRKSKQFDTHMNHSTINDGYSTRHSFGAVGSSSTSMLSRGAAATNPNVLAPLVTDRACSKAQSIVGANNSHNSCSYTIKRSLSANGGLAMGGYITNGHDAVAAAAAASSSSSCSSSEYHYHSSIAGGGSKSSAGIFTTKTADSGDDISVMSRSSAASSARAALRQQQHTHANNQIVALARSTHTMAEREKEQQLQQLSALQGTLVQCGRLHIVQEQSHSAEDSKLKDAFARERKHMHNHAEWLQGRNGNKRIPNSSSIGNKYNNNTENGINNRNKPKLSKLQRGHSGSVGSIESSDWGSLDGILKTSTEGVNNKEEDDDDDRDEDGPLQTSEHKRNSKRRKDMLNMNINGCPDRVSINSLAKSILSAKNNEPVDARQVLQDYRTKYKHIASNSKTISASGEQDTILSKKKSNNASRSVAGGEGASSSSSSSSSSMTSASSSKASREADNISTASTGIVSVLNTSKTSHNPFRARDISSSHFGTDGVAASYNRTNFKAPNPLDPLSYKQDVLVRTFSHMNVVIKPESSIHSIPSRLEVEQAQARIAKKSMLSYSTKLVEVGNILRCLKDPRHLTPGAEAILQMHRAFIAAAALNPNTWLLTRKQVKQVIMAEVPWVNPDSAMRLVLAFDPTNIGMVRYVRISATLLCCMQPAMTELAGTMNRVRENVHKREKNKANASANATLAAMKSSTIKNGFDLKSTAIFDASIGGIDKEKLLAEPDRGPTWRDETDDDDDVPRIPTEYEGEVMVIRMLFSLYEECGGGDGSFHGDGHNYGTSAPAGMPISDLSEMFSCCVMSIDDELNIDRDIQPVKQFLFDRMQKSDILADLHPPEEEDAPSPPVPFTEEDYKAAMSGAMQRQIEEEKVVVYTHNALATKLLENTPDAQADAILSSSGSSKFNNNNNNTKSVAANATSSASTSRHDDGSLSIVSVPSVVSSSTKTKPTKGVHVTKSATIKPRRFGDDDYAQATGLCSVATTKTGLSLLSPASSHQIGKGPGGDGTMVVSGGSSTAWDGGRGAAAHENDESSFASIGEGGGGGTGGGGSGSLTSGGSWRGGGHQHTSLNSGSCLDNDSRGSSVSFGGAGGGGSGGTNNSSSNNNRTNDLNIHNRSSDDAVVNVDSVFKYQTLKSVKKTDNVLKEDVIEAITWNLPFLKEYLRQVKEFRARALPYILAGSTSIDDSFKAFASDAQKVNIV